MVVYSTRRRCGRGLAYILYIRVREQVHLAQCRDILVSEACATSKLWNWLFKHHTTPRWATCMHAVVILGHSRVMLPSVGPWGEQVHLTQCRHFSVSGARATSKLWKWLFKHHTTPLCTTCMQAVVILARTLTCDASIYGPTRPSLMHPCSIHASHWPTSGEVN